MTTFMRIASALLALAAVPALAGTLVGSKHDLTALNMRAKVEAMTGLAFNNYRDPCIYCHLPADAKATSAFNDDERYKDWNRYFSNQEDYLRYESASNKVKPGQLGPQSLVCLSCHDGSMAVDMVVSKPGGWSTKDDAPMHMKLDKGGGLDRCTQCHDGVTAHKMDHVVIGRNLMDDHPVGIKYPGLFGNEEYHPPGRDGTFRNGVKLFDNQVECATCHDVHQPDVVPFLRVEQSELCITCHNK
ncbi:cytochrome c3 family protein [Azospirillum sp.]|uniref:cytochrome c3 family protein n=1 Tax=Azospirillum sp. TaxID=34012 RepID=UPI003D72FBE2